MTRKREMMSNAQKEIRSRWLKIKRLKLMTTTYRTNPLDNSRRTDPRLVHPVLHQPSLPTSTVASLFHLT
jgi:hypothetical protein